MKLWISKISCEVGHRRGKSGELVLYKTLITEAVPMNTTLDLFKNSLDYQSEKISGSGCILSTSTCIEVKFINDLYGLM